MFGNWLSDKNIDIAPGQWSTVISVFDCSRLNKGIRKSRKDVWNLSL